MKKFLYVFIVSSLFLILTINLSNSTPQVISNNNKQGWISIPIFCFNDTSHNVAPDSVHVLVWFDSCGANTRTYANRCILTADSAWIDSTRYAGALYYYYTTPIAFIDGDKGSGNYHGVVVAFKQGYQTPNLFSFQIIDNDTTLSTRLGLLDATTSSRLAPAPAGRLLHIAPDSTAYVSYDSSRGTIGNTQLEDSILTRAKFKDLCFDSSAFTSTFWVDVRRLQNLAGTQTFNNTGTWTGNLSGSVGSISGVTFPTNFGVLSISATTGLVDITQVAADKVWGTTARTLTDKAGFKLAADGLEQDTSFTNVQGTVHSTANFQGAKDGFTQHLRPYGSANKDSVEVKNSAGTKTGTIYYFHTGSIIDTLRYEEW